MKLGFIKPNYPGEKRVALLPEDVNHFPDEIVIESGFGDYLEIKDIQYVEAGCTIAERSWIFAHCEGIFALKLIQPSDYPFLRANQTIIGWTHPRDSGTAFYNDICKPLNIKVVDLDNIAPSVYCQDQKYLIPFIPRNFVAKNSFIAGYSATVHALLTYGMILNSQTKIAVLSSGNVAQGAFSAAVKLGGDVRMYYRKTMPEFKAAIGDFDVIINGIEMDQPDQHLIARCDLKKMKTGALIIDAAADAGNTIEGTHYTHIAEPIYEEAGKFFYEVNNAPSLFYRSASKAISHAFSKDVYTHAIADYLKVIA